MQLNDETERNMLELMRQVHRQRIHQEDRAQRANALAELHVRPLIHSPPSSTALHCTSLTRHVPSVRAEQHEHTPHTPHARGTQNACSVAQSLTDARPRRTTNRLDACGCCCRQSGALRVARTSAFCARGLRALHFAAFYCTTRTTLCGICSLLTRRIPALILNLSALRLLRSTAASYLLEFFYHSLAAAFYLLEFFYQCLVHYEYFARRYARVA